jgi:hypothetical protein
MLELDIPVLGYITQMDHKPRTRTTDRSNMQHAAHASSVQLQYIVHLGM